MTLKSATVLTLFAFMVGAAPAAAAISCKDGYQKVSGTFIATPYCQDSLLGDVARASGIRVSNAEIRNNPNIKRDVCRTVGRDNRVYVTCLDSNANGRRF
jgi:hypothetical protein